MARKCVIVPATCELSMPSVAQCSRRPKYESSSTISPSAVPVLIPLSHHHITIEQPVGLVAALYGLLAPPKPF